MRLTVTLHHPNWDEPKTVTGTVVVTGEDTADVVVEAVDGWPLGRWPDRLVVSLAEDELWRAYAALEEAR